MRAAMSGPLDGRGAVVTGGGRGIGAAVARALSAAGAAVLVAARTRAEVERVAAELRAGGGAAHAAVCDVTDPQSVEALARAAEGALGKVDILVNNAGVATSAPVRALALEDWRRAIDVNATGAFLCSKAFVAGMAARGWGRIVNVASVAARTGLAYTAAYSASKHAVLGLTRCLALEVARDGVTVNAVCPGFVATDMTEETIRRIAEKTGLSREAALERILAFSPQRRLIEPDEVAYVVAALCDPRARGINGQAIVVDGGGLVA